MSRSIDKKGQELFPAKGLFLPEEGINLMKDLDSIGKSSAEIKRRGALKELRKEWNKHFKKSS